MEKRELKLWYKYKHFKNKEYLPILIYDGSILNLNDHNYIKYGQAINTENDEVVTILMPSDIKKCWCYTTLIVDKNNNPIKGKYVLYKALYSPYGLFIREYNEFMSEVDKEKYPNVEQKYRFELIE